MEYVLSVRFLAATLLCLAVGTGATWVRTHTYLEGLTAYRINRQDHGFEAKGYVHPYPLTYSGVTVDKRPALLSIFYNGLQPSRPMSVRVTANRDPRTEDQYERANPISDLFQTVDLMSFAALVMSLLALVFSYDLISGEKEAGTLRLMLSFPVSQGQAAAWEMDWRIHCPDCPAPPDSLLQSRDRCALSGGRTFDKGSDRLQPPDPGHAFVYQRFLFPRASRLIRDIPGIYVDYGPRCGMGGNDGGGAEPESLYRP